MTWYIIAAEDHHAIGARIVHRSVILPTHGYVGQLYPTRRTTKSVGIRKNPGVCQLCDAWDQASLNNQTIALRSVDHRVVYSASRPRTSGRELDPCWRTV